MLPGPLRRRALGAAFDRAQAAFNRGDMEAVTALFAQDVEYAPPPPLGGGEIYGREAVLEFWREVLARYPHSAIENLEIRETAPGRFVRTARLSHAGAGADTALLEYEIVQTTWLRAGRVVRQVNELAR